jgi:hypothetical protein
MIFFRADVLAEVVLVVERWQQVRMVRVFLPKVREDGLRADDELR